MCLWLHVRHHFMHRHLHWLGKKYSVCVGIAMRRAGRKGLTAIQSKNSRKTSRSMQWAVQECDKDHGKRSPSWVFSLSPMDPELPAKRAKIQIHVPFVFKTYREQFAEMLYCHTLFLLLISAQRDVAVTFSQNHEYKTCLFFPLWFSPFLGEVYFIFKRSLSCDCVLASCLDSPYFCVTFTSETNQNYISGQLFFVGSLPGFPYSGSDSKNFTFSCTITPKSTEGWYCLNTGFPVKGIQLGFQIQNSRASLTGKTLYSSIFSLCSGLVWCLVMEQH